MATRFAADDLPTNPTSLFNLQIGAIVGDSTNAQHPKTIDVLTWPFGSDTTISPFSTGSGPSRSTSRDFTFVARMGSHSPVVHSAAAKGTNFAKATLWGRRDLHRGGVPRSHAREPLRHVVRRGPVRLRRFPAGRGAPRLREDHPLLPAPDPDRHVHHGDKTFDYVTNVGN